MHHSKDKYNLVELLLQCACSGLKKKIVKYRSSPTLSIQRMENILRDTSDVSKGSLNQIMTFLFPIQSIFQLLSHHLCCQSCQTYSQMGPYLHGPTFYQCERASESLPWSWPSVGCRGAKTQQPAPSEPIKTQGTPFDPIYFRVNQEQYKPRNLKEEWGKDLRFDIFQNFFLFCVCFKGTFQVRRSGKEAL